MHLPPALEQLAQENPIIHNGLQLHLIGGASLTAALVVIIEALAEENANQELQLLQALQGRRPTFFLPSGDPRN